MNHNNQTKSANIIFSNYPEWLKEIKAYTKFKKEYPKIEHEQYPIKVTHQIMASRNNIFNPIKQKYNNTDFNSSIIAKEKEIIKSTIANNYDNMLANEQAFDIITLKDKFAPFKHHIKYPLSKSRFHLKQNKETSKAPYNIISNISLSHHHYNPPENPLIASSDSNIDALKCSKVRSINFRDYNIINNNYYKHHKEKMETEKEMEQYAAAKKFLRNQAYNLIQGRYFDNEREEEYQLNQKQKEDFKRSRSSSSNNVMFNPVNHHVYDEGKLKEYDDKIDNKRKRFALREGIEDYYRQKNYSKDLKQEQEKSNRVSYFKFKAADERGYDILNYKNTFNQYKEGKGIIKGINKDSISGNSNNIKNKLNDWELIQNGASDNQTFKTKPIYTSLYDSSDVNIKKHLYDKYRREKLRILPKLEDDPMFNLRIPCNTKSHKMNN